MNDERFALLVERHLEGVLTDDEARELAGALAASPERRRRMLEETGLAGLLARTQAKERGDLVPRVLSALRDGNHREEMVGRVLQGIPGGGRPFRAAPWIIGLAAALLIGAMAAVYFSGSPAAGEGIAVLDDGRPVTPGMRLEGDARIAYPDGSTVRLADARAVVPDGRRLVLESGRIEADARGMLTVGTPHGESAGSGSFEVLAGADATRVAAGDGRVQLVRKEDGLAIELPPGTYAVAAPDDPGLLEARKPVDPEEVRKAVARAVAWLGRQKPPPSSHHGPMPSDALVALALAHGGAVPGPALRRRVLEEPLRRTYVVSVTAMALAKLDPGKYRDRLRACAQFLVDNQCVTGQWSYGKPVEPPGDRVVRRRDGDAHDANNSCSLMAMMGLRACADAGIAIPQEVFVRAGTWWTRCQRPDKDRVFGGDRAGWCYTREEEPHHPYGSMTAGALAAAVVADAYGGADWRSNRAVAAAIGWLGYHFSVHENYGPVEPLMDKEFLSDTPQPTTEYFYYLWALERAAGVTGRELFGGHDWYHEGARAILGAQRPDGSWHSGVKRCDPVWDTAYAILFLTRSTNSLEAR